MGVNRHYSLKDDSHDLRSLIDHCVDPLILIGEGI